MALRKFFPTPTDRIVWLAVLALCAGILLILLRGDQISVQAIGVTPPPTARDVSTRSPIEIRLDQPIATLNDGAALTIVPELEGELRREGNLLRFLPSAGLQPNTTYTVTLAAGLRSQQGHLLHKPFSWQFRTGQIEALYSNTDANGVEQLYAVAVDLAGHKASQPVQLTNLPPGIWDFTVAPAGDRIVYSLLNQDGTGDLWLIHPGAGDAEPLVGCDDAVCSGAAWSPDGQYLAYSRRNSTEFAAGVISPPRLWLLNPASAENAPVFDDNQKLAFEPRWSSDGRWLSYLAPDLGGVGIVNLYDSHTGFYETTTGEPGVWQPAQHQLLITVLRQLGENYVVHMVLIDVTTNSQRNLSGEDALVEDGSAAWSPDGSRLAFRRKALAGPTATLGKQIWVMNSDGSAAHALTSDPAFDYGPPAWSPDGRYLLFHKLPLKGPEIIITVWALDAESGVAWQVAPAGQRPLWLP